MKPREKKQSGKSLFYCPFGSTPSTFTAPFQHILSLAIVKSPATARDEKEKKKRKKKRRRKKKERRKRTESECSNNQDTVATEAVSNKSETAPTAVVENTIKEKSDIDPVEAAGDN